MAVLLVGCIDVANNYMTAGELSSFIFYSALVANSIAGLSEIFGEIQGASGVLARLSSLERDIDDGIKQENCGVKVVNDVTDCIKFENVSFSYSTLEENILDKFSIKVCTGETIALVGRSGIGKSTLFSLLVRFYECNSGKIYIDDCNIKDISFASLRSLFGYVQQDPMIFYGTIYDNIIYGTPNATLDEVYGAAEMANILDCINSMPKKFDTYVGERGIKLSGGQRQRIAIARVILKNPKILLLDEATSALDAQNEKLVQIALSNLMKNKTTFVIAHKLSTVMHVNRIIVLGEDGIEDVGTHEELIKKCGLYSNLAKLQFHDAL